MPKFCKAYFYPIINFTIIFPETIYFKCCPHTVYSFLWLLLGAKFNRRRNFYAMRAMIPLAPYETLLNVKDASWTL